MRRRGAAGCLRELLARQALASERYRAAVARRLGLSDLEMGAIAYPAGPLVDPRGAARAVGVEARAG